MALLLLVVLFAMVAFAPLRVAGHYAKAPVGAPMTLRGLADGIILGFSGRTGDVGSVIPPVSVSGLGFLRFHNMTATRGPQISKRGMFSRPVPQGKKDKASACGSK